MDIKIALGIALRKARKASNLTQEDFSTSSSRTYMSVLEAGGKSAKVEKIDIIAKTMKVHPLTIFSLAYMELDGLDSDDLLELVKNELRLIMEA